MSPTDLSLATLILSLCFSILWGRAGLSPEGGGPGERAVCYSLSWASLACLVLTPPSLPHRGPAGYRKPRAQRSSLSPLASQIRTKPRDLCPLGGDTGQSLCPRWK